MQYGPRLRTTIVERQVKNWLNPVATGSGASLKTMQLGSITVSNGNNTNTATITSVDTTNSILVFMGSTSDIAGYTPNSSEGYLTFTNATTITVNRNGPTGALVVNFAVMEFNTGLINSIQRGTISTTGTSNTATISSVSTTKSAVFFLGAQNNYSGGSGEVDILFARLALTNATTVTLSVGANGNAVTVTGSYQVVEFV